MSEIKHFLELSQEFKLTFLSSILFICTTILWHLPVESSYSSWARGVQVACHPFELGSAELPSYHATSREEALVFVVMLWHSLSFFLASQAPSSASSSSSDWQRLLIVIVTWCGALWHRPPLLNMKNKENILVPKDKEIFLFLRSPKLVEMHTLHLLESLMAANATIF